MTLSERISKQKPEPQKRRQPEWVRRAQEQFKRVGYLAVADLTPTPRRAA